MTNINSIEVEYSGDDKEARKHIAEKYAPYDKRIEEYFKNGTFENVEIEDEDFTFILSEGYFLIEEKVSYKIHSEDPNKEVLGSGYIDYIDCDNVSLIDNKEDFDEFLASFKEKDPNFLVEWYRTDFYGEQKEYKESKTEEPERDDI